MVGVFRLTTSWVPYVSQIGIQAVIRVQQSVVNGIRQTKFGNSATVYSSPPPVIATPTVALRTIVVPSASIGPRRSMVPTRGSCTSAVTMRSCSVSTVLTATRCVASKNNLIMRKRNLTSIILYSARSSAPGSPSTSTKFQYMQSAATLSLARHSTCLASDLRPQL